MQAEQKIVAKLVKHDNFSLDDRDFLMNLRRSLLQMLSVVEKKLGLHRKCRRCGNVLSD